MGIPEEEIKNLFKAFSQVSSVARSKSGSTGLGLAISKEIITAHHGGFGSNRVWDAGAGSIFSFLNHRKRRSDGREKILIVDDEPDVLLVLASD